MSGDGISMRNPVILQSSSHRLPNDAFREDVRSMTSRISAVLDMNGRHDATHHVVSTNILEVFKKII